MFDHVYMKLFVLQPAPIALIRCLPSSVYVSCMGDYTERHHTILSRITELTLELSDLKLELSRLEKSAKAKRHLENRSRDTGSNARGSLGELEEGSEMMRRELIRMRADIEEKRRNNEVLLREIAKMKEKLKIKPRHFSGYDVAGNDIYGNCYTAVSDWPNMTTHDGNVGKSHFSSFPTPLRLSQPITPTKKYPSISGNYRTQADIGDGRSYLDKEFQKNNLLMNATPKFRPSDWDFPTSSGQKKEVYRPSTSTVESRAFRHNYPTYPVHY
ncbi:hypothetical protein Btru_030668 [Bulinus truncatus]|nr:hypothetical protein Btru_030668 [Bulinus truncatus]